MRIIRPQQLAVIKGSYQIGSDSQLGLSVVAGCYLSRPTHFINEAELWEAWKRAPLSLQVLDAAEPKPFAEYLITGHAGIGEWVKTLNVSADIGGLKRYWRVEGEGKKGGIALEPFLSVPLDHPSTYGGKACRENPLGRGFQNEQRPLLMTLSADGSPQACSPLAAPAPVPHMFAQRKSYIDNVAKKMAGKDYLETTFPGLPTDIDQRYFQMAPPEQWLTEAQWQQNISFELLGMGGKSEAIRGELPAVSGRAFIRRQLGDDLEEIELQRKTLWFLPDSDIGLMIFTGHTPLEHLLDESIESIMVALDRCDVPRTFDHFRQVYHRRSDDSASPFEFLFDPDLMPVDMGLSVIRTISDHPNSLRYEPTPTPMSDSLAFYQRIRDAIALHQQQTAIKPATTIMTEVPDLADEQGYETLLRDNTTLEGKTFTRLRCHDGLSDRHFRHCRFDRCDFSLALLENCTFEACIFDSVNLSQATLRSVRMNACTLQHSVITGSLWQDTLFEKVTLEEPDAQRLRVENARLDYCIFQCGDLSEACFGQCVMGNCMFNGTTLNQTQFLQVEVDACVFNRCEAKAVSGTECRFIKTSFLSGTWQNVNFERCNFESMTAGMKVDVSGGIFSDCSFTKVGLKQARMDNCRLQYSVFSESNFDQADLTASSITDCDMAGARFKDSILVNSCWQNSSIQQGMFYNADLRDVRFDQCNLAATNLAMTWQNSGTRFSDCLLTRACWLPRRRDNEGLMHES